jgi:hypothetical protein
MDHGMSRPVTAIKTPEMMRIKSSSLKLRNPNSSGDQPRPRAFDARAIASARRD